MRSVNLYFLMVTIILGMLSHKRTSFWEMSQLSNVSSVQRAFAISTQETQEKVFKCSKTLSREPNSDFDNEIKQKIFTVMNAREML